jgi:hypothetical protein
LSHDYLELYERELRAFADRPITILEFGEGSDAGLRVWLDYFPQATIVGVFPEAACLAFARDRVTIEIGNQGDKNFLRYLIGTHAPDIVIDDGWHRWDMQILALQYLFPVLRPGGLYIIEDLHTSFGPENEKQYRGEASKSTMEYLQSLVPGVTVGPEEVANSEDRFARHFAAEAASVTFVAKSCIIRKIQHPDRSFLQIVPLDKAGCHVDVVEQSEAYTRAEPTIVGAPTWQAGELAEQLNLQPVHTIPARVSRFSDATVIWPGIVRTSAGHIVAETVHALQPVLHYFGMHQIGDTDVITPERDIEPQRFVFGEQHVPLSRIWDGNYGHWIVECLPLVERVAALYDLAECKFLVSPWVHMQKIYRDSLALFDIPADRIVTTEYETMFFERLVYPLPITYTPWLIGPQAIRTLERLRDRSLRRSGMPLGPQKLYVSRNRTSSRRLRNEPEVLTLLTSHGYHIVHPEELTLAEQIAKFSGALYVVGNLGAALTNLAFAPRDVRLLALTTEMMKDDFYWDLMAQKSGVYFSLHGRAVDPSLGMQSDFDVDLDLLKTLLAQLEAH